MSSNKLIILDYPEGYKFGIDLRLWTVGPNFKGVKGIPNGCHYVYYGANEDMNNAGFFIHLNDGQVVVKKWCKVEEDLLDYNLNENDIVRFEDNMKEIERHLGKYYIDNHRDWWSLSNYISKDIVSTLMPDCGRIYSVEQFESSCSSTAERSAQLPVPQKDKDGLWELPVKSDTRIHFLTIPRYSFPPAASASVTTHCMLDRTWGLEQCLSQRRCLGSVHGTPKATVIGELQFSFIVYNLGYHMPALEQWLAIVDLLCSCVEAVTKYQDVYVAFITVLHYQMKLTDQDFADITTQNNRFYNSMKKLFSVILEECNVTDELKTRALGLKQELQQKNEWDFDEELDDDLPVIVEIV